MLVFIDNLVVFTEILLYLCFSFLMGGLLISIIPEEKRPTIHFSKKLLLVTVFLIPILSFVPLVETAVYLSENMGFWLSFKSILFTFEIGKGWLFTLSVSILLYILLFINDLQKQPSLSKVAILLTFFLAGGLGYSGHASSITEWSGFIAHTVHFIAVIVWIGLLLVVGWFSKDRNNWQSFLRWFSPLAIICVIILSIAGFFTMEIDIQNYDDWNTPVLSEYKNSWLVNYGQALLIKHLLIIPLLLFALINGFIIRLKWKENSDYNPIKWVRVEGVYAFLVFVATAFMGQDYPPHQIRLLLESAGPSPLFNAIYQGVIKPDMEVVLNFGITSYFLFALATIFLGLIVLSVFKKAPSVIVIFVALGFVMSSYLGLMLGVQ